MARTSSPRLDATKIADRDQDLPDPVDWEVGRRIFSRRKQLRLSQTALGEGIGVSFQQIQKYERGSNRVSTSALYRISAVLDVPMGYFFATLPDPGHSRQTPLGRQLDTHLDFVASEEGRRLVDTFLRLPKPLRPRFIAMLDTLNAVHADKR
ncbi:helix-turn-helix domain-containing protein [Aliirhizobium smilacinae]|uniref:Helix-turn-helix domain-containing protein n=1 Tax=Aliirhizobium smilacinae TaxID=1395944 RepID=A0A5C4XP34_9HYPH|nr:helix-turn-helix domain-containing protein [Rhizobium smilacinae]TNM65296.1 helix-turn-helix domain-containing protein [Rhizobium smilacinae]